ncbi:MAG: hypothetical protein ACREBR_05395 [bacterium]
MALTDEQMGEKLESVKQIQVFLDPDPTIKGLVSLNYKLAELQKAKSDVTTLLLEAMKNMAEYEILKETAQNEHDRKQDYIIASDPTVQAQKSAEQRSIHARLKMPDLVLGLHHATIAEVKATWYLKCLQLVSSNLESANSNLSRQITVIQMDQNLQDNGLGRPNAVKTLNI